LTNGNREARITIIDHGGGVPEDELAKLFRPFHRVEEARDRVSGGTGLGLAIAERAVRAHKGTISAENTADGLKVEIVLTQANGSNGLNVS
jgi:two-component system sensor histidine kinase CpxA